MNNYLKRYKIRLKTLAPLYIGSGECLGKKEYVYDRIKKKAYIFKKEKLYEGIISKGLTIPYEDYILNENKDLYGWMNERNVKEYPKWADYVLDCSNAELSARVRDINLFVKDPYGNPYIPGSSLKGALRTILLGERLSDNAAKFRRNLSEIENNSRERNRRKMQNMANSLETVAFHTVDRGPKVDKKNAVCDELAGIRISDSQPLSVKDLVLCQKVDQNIEGNQAVMPMLRECIKPGIEICFDMVIDKSICSYSITDIQKAIDEVYSMDCMFYNKFDRLPSNQKGILYCGGGSGFVSKTMEYKAYPYQTAVKISSDILQNQFRKHGHNQDTRRRVSPHILKKTKYNGRDYNMGMCCISFDEA